MQFSHRDVCTRHNTVCSQNVRISLGPNIFKFSAKHRLLNFQREFTQWFLRSSNNNTNGFHTYMHIHVHMRRFFLFELICLHLNSTIIYILKLNECELNKTRLYINCQCTYSLVYVFCHNLHLCYCIYYSSPTIRNKVDVSVRNYIGLMTLLVTERRVYLHYFIR